MCVCVYIYIYIYRYIGILCIYISPRHILGGASRRNHGDACLAAPLRQLSSRNIFLEMCRMSKGRSSTIDPAPWRFERSKGTVK